MYNIEDGEHKEDVVVSWIITHKCQEGCAYCISPKCSTEIEDEKSHMLIQDKLIKNGVTKIRYIGGEPLLIPHICKLVKDAHERGVNTRISTNARLLTPELFDKIKDYVDSLAFPFESLDDELNESIRNSKNHKAIIQSRIEMVKKCKNIGIIINTCVHKENYDKLMELGNYLNNVKVNHWKLRKFAYHSGRGAVKNKERFNLSDELFFDTVHKLQETYHNIKINERLPKKLETRLMVSPQGDLYRMVGDAGQFVHYGNILKDDLNIQKIYEKDHCN